MIGERGSKPPFSFPSLWRVLPLVLILQVFTAGCLTLLFWDGHPFFIEFISPSEAVSDHPWYAEFKLLGDTIKVVINAEFKRFDAESYQVEVGVGLERLQQGGQIIVNPNSLSVAFEGRPMIRRSGTSLPPDTIEGIRYGTSDVFILYNPIRQETAGSPKLTPTDSMRLTITLDGFLCYNGREITLDTVRAVDPYVGYSLQQIK